LNRNKKNGFLVYKQVYNKEKKCFHCGANERRGIGVTTVPAENGVLCGDGE